MVQNIYNVSKNVDFFVILLGREVLHIFQGSQNIMLL